MRTITTVAAMQRLAGTWRRQGIRVGFVPTMGYLHEGHISLVQRARMCVGPSGMVGVSIYVNPTQFGPKEDLSRYPRDLDRDKRLCREAGTDVLFVPTDAGMYPGKEQGGYSTYVVEENLSQVMEGAARPTHFRGVTTEVAKLFNLVQPEVAVFGAKDFQQAAIIQRMVQDLNFPVRVVVAPTRRESDGLAMSSRNKYLNPAQRTQAVALSQALRQARETVRRARHPVPASGLKSTLQKFIQQQPEARVEYIEFFEPETLRAVAEVRPGTQMALAVFVGATRLIDNGRL